MKKVILILMILISMSVTANAALIPKEILKGILQDMEIEINQDLDNIYIVREMNNYGDVIYTLADYSSYPTDFDTSIWKSDGEVLTLWSFPGWRDIIGYVINDNIEIAGTVRKGTSNPYTHQTFKWSEEEGEAIYYTNGAEAVKSINNQGHICGSDYSYTYSIPQVRFPRVVGREQYCETVAIDTTEIGFTHGSCGGINENNQVVGIVYNTYINGNSKDNRPFICNFEYQYNEWEQQWYWDYKNLRKLGVLLGYEYSEAYDINDNGTVVGISYNKSSSDISSWTGGKVFVWEEETGMADTGITLSSKPKYLQINNYGIISEGRYGNVWWNGVKINLLELYEEIFQEEYDLESWGFDVYHISDYGFLLYTDYGPRTIVRMKFGNYITILDPLPVAIDIDPNTINLNGRGLITAYIQPLEGYSPADIDVETIECQEANVLKSTIDGDTLVVKFKRQDLRSLEVGENVEMIIEGRFNDGVFFKGSDSVRITIIADLDENGRVDYVDFGLLGSEWLANSLWFCEPDAVGWWPFDEGFGQTAHDLSGYGHDGTLSDPSPTWITADLNGVLDFNGIDNYIEVTSCKGVTGTQSRTVTAWINADYAADGVIINWGQATGVDGGKWRFKIDSSSGALRVSVTGGYTMATTNIKGTGWRHAAVVFDGDGTGYVSDIKFYVDGVIDPTSSFSNMSVNTTDNQNVSIGASLDGSTLSQYFKGKIDDVRIYDFALTDEMIQQVYNRESPAGLVCTEYPQADFDHDCLVNINDLLIFTQYWLWEE